MRAINSFFLAADVHILFEGYEGRICGSACIQYSSVHPFLVCVSAVLGVSFQCACWQISEAESKEKDIVMGPYAGVDYNPTLCPLQIRLKHIYHGQPYVRVNLNPMPGVIFIAQSGT